MNKLRGTTRRGFLRAIILMGAFIFSPLTRAFQRPGEAAITKQTAEKLVNSIIRRQSAKTVGLEYLRRVPEETDLRMLVDLIYPSRQDINTEIAYENKKKIRKSLLQQHNQDLEHGRTVNVQGWILSETEARLCALAALI